jgi:uncharacterized protein (TIGR02145 family)
VCDVFPEGPCQGQSFVSYQNFNYDIVEIAGGCWFADDLRSTTYLNGDTIPNNQSNADWSAANESGIGSWSVYPGYEYNGNIYNWYSVLDPRGLCPSGWHVPSRQEYIDLVEEVNTDYNLNSYYSVSLYLKDNMSWNGTNQTGFKARITIYRNHVGSFYDNVNEYLGWTSDYGTFGNSFFFKLISSNSGDSVYLNSITGSQTNQGAGHAIRCLKN